MSILKIYPFNTFQTDLWTYSNNSKMERREPVTVLSSNQIYFHQNLKRNMSNECKENTDLLCLFFYLFCGEDSRGLCVETTEYTNEGFTLVVVVSFYPIL